MIESIDLSTVRHLVLRKQRLVPSTQGRSKEDVVKVIKQVCGVQYDPLPVIAQAHYVTLWNRVRDFKETWLDSLLYEEKRLIEFMLMRLTTNIVATEELPYYFQGTRRVARAGWVQKVIDRKENEASQEVLKKLKEKGEVSPKDFQYSALRPLFYSGKIFIARREKGIFRMPYYRLFSDNFPHLNLESVDEETACQHLVLKVLSAYGISSSRHVAYWMGYKVKETEEILRKLENEKLIIRVRIEGLKGYHWMKIDDFNSLRKDDSGEDFVSLLTLMDNLVRDRKWLQQLFNYTFEVEYFQKKGMKWHVNILYGDEFLGFIDPKMDRTKRIFIIKNMTLRRELKHKEWDIVLERIEELAKFHSAETMMVTSSVSNALQRSFQKHGYRMDSTGRCSLKLN